MKDKHHRQPQQGNSPADTQQSAPPVLSEDANGQQPNAQRTANQSDDAQTKVNEQRFQRTHMRLMLVFTGALVVVTGAYAWFAGGQWQATDATLKEIKQSRELEYRAYVGAKAALFVPRSDNPAYANVILVSVNTGRTGVRDLVIKRVLEVRDSSPPDTTEVKDNGGLTSKTAYLPNIEYRSYIGVIETQLADILRAQQTLAAQGISTAPTPKLKEKPKPSPDQGPIASLTVPTMPEFGRGYYLYGIIEYKDIFTKPHKTKFCFFIPQRSSEFLTCPTFNDAD